jgi:pSer/pThr/pTyr-binding forkhead associated (FHA) protein
LSRTHAIIDFIKDHRSEKMIPHLIDNGSTNGTFINGEPVDKGALKQTCKVKLGEVDFKFIQSGSDIGATAHISTLDEDLLNDLELPPYLQEQG